MSLFSMHLRRLGLTSAILGVFSCQASLTHGEVVSEATLAGEVYTILNRSCFECHGPAKQEGGLRLDSRESLIEGGDSGPGIVSRDVTSSELYRRISLPKGHAEVMPKRGNILSQREVDRIREWIMRDIPWSAEAATQKHWAYVAPKRPPLSDGYTPTSKLHELPPIDHFIRMKLSREGLSPSPAADPRVLLRRLSLDIIGLPPTPAEADAFAEEAAVDLQLAVEQSVDRLLLSPQYGEKWARPWLDAARYADSHGFQRDDLHELWAYRDWVIQALNDDMPFDEFTIQQLAGDLLPDATESQRIATGFNRCAPCNVEAGTDPEENRFNQVVDRVNTLGYVWLGSTLECAQCHNHKFDPFTQRDYYGLFAFFNQSELEADRSNPKVPGSIRFNGPYLKLAGPEPTAQSKRLDKQIKTTRAKLDLAIEQAAEKPSDAANVDVARPVTTSVLQPIDFDSSGGSTHEILDDGSILLSGDPPDKDTCTITVEIGQEKIVGLLLEAMIDESLPGNGPGRGDPDRANFVLNTFEVRGIDNSGQPAGQDIALCDARADFSQGKYDVANAIDENEKSGWAISPQFHRPHWATFRITDSAALDGFARINIRLVQNFGQARSIGRMRLSAIYGDYATWQADDNRESPEIVSLRAELAKLESQRDSKSAAKTLVMQEVDQPRMSTMFARGDFRQPGENVQPSTPVVLHEYRQDEPRNRLALARWLVSRDNSLVARVVVNRWWSEIFGSGLVKTPEDFGLKGEPPTHAELLDWLAVEFMDTGWSQKKLLRTILTSQTYRQASRVTPELLERDPNNDLLARGPRFRLSAESIRDNALAIAGTLSLKQFGPPIRPPQPDGLWAKVGGNQYDYQVSPGEDKYRRGIYVIIKRMSPYPSFITFDATARLACRVSRGRSNTPLQALTLLNDPVYVEAAHAMADRVQRELPNADLNSQLEYAFRLAVIRVPTERERHLLRALFDGQRAAAIGIQPASDEKHLTPNKAAEQSAWYAVASAVLNLDESITKE